MWSEVRNVPHFFSSTGDLRRPEKTGPILPGIILKNIWGSIRNKTPEEKSLHGEDLRFSPLSSRPNGCPHGRKGESLAFVIPVPFASASSWLRERDSLFLDILLLFLLWGHSDALRRPSLSSRVADFSYRSSASLRNPGKPGVPILLKNYPYRPKYHFLLKNLFLVSGSGSFIVRNYCRREQRQVAPLACIRRAWRQPSAIFIRASKNWVFRLLPLNAHLTFSPLSRQLYLHIKLFPTTETR